MASGITNHDAYIVVSDDAATRLMITFEMNSVMTGLRQDDSDRDHQAVFLVRQGLDRNAVAMHLHISPARVDDLIRERNAEERATSLSVYKEWKKIPARNSRLQLSRITLDAPFVFATKLVSLHCLTIKDAQKIVNSLLKMGSENEQMNYLKEIESDILAQIAAEAEAEKERKEAKRTKVRNRPMDNPIVRFKAHLKFVINVDLNFGDEILAGMDQSERQAIALLIKEAQSGLQKALELAES